MNNNDNLPFDLSVVTQDGTSNLYLDTANTVTLTATSNGTLLTGADSVLFLEFFHTLRPDAWTNAQVNAPGFSATVISPDRPTQWKLIPNETGWTIPSPIVITLSGVEPKTGDAPSSTTLTFSWQNIPGVLALGRTVRLRILQSQSPALEDLHLNFNWIDPVSQSGPNGSGVQSVYVSNGEFQPILNNVALSIGNPSDTAPVVSETGPQPRFWLTFNFVVAAGDSGDVDAICTYLEANDNTTVTVQDGLSAWSAASTWDAYQDWQLLPPLNVLDAGQSVIIDIHAIVSYLPCYATEMFVNWADVAGYKDGGTALPMLKQQAAPQILSFSCSPAGGIAAGQEITLSWKTYGDRSTGPVTIFDQDHPDTQIVSAGNAIGSVTVSPLIPLTYVLEIQDVPTWPLPIDVEQVAVSNLSVTPAKSLYNIGDSVTLNATVSFASSYEVDPGVLAPTKLFGSTTIAVPVTVTRGTYTLTATGYGAPAVAVWTLPISGSALPGTLYLAIDDGIYSLDPQLATTRIVEISPELVTDTCVFNGQIYWGRTDIAAIFYANLDGSAAASTSTSASVLSMTLSNQWVASQAAAVCSDGSVYIMPLRNPGWVRTVFQLSPVDVTTKIRTMASYCLMSTSTGIYDWSIDDGQTSPVTVDIAAVSTVLVVPPGDFMDNPSADSSDQQAWGYYNDTASAAIFGIYPNADTSIVKICSAQPSANSNLVIFGSDDLYWFEDAVGGGRSLWHCNIPSNKRTQVWWTEKLACALTTDVSNF